MSIRVSELINQLKEFPADAEVVVNYDGYELQPAYFQYYAEYYPTDYDKCQEINGVKNVVVHSC